MAHLRARSEGRPSRTFTGAVLLLNQLWIFFDQFFDLCLGLGDLFGGQFFCECIFPGLGLGETIGYGEGIPLVRLHLVFLYTSANGVPASKVGLCPRMPLLGGLAVPLDCFLFIFGDALSLAIFIPKTVLRTGIRLFSSLAVSLDCF